MHAIVCMKFYQNTNNKSTLSASMNDNSALGLALKLKQTFVDKISVVCMGPQSVQNLLKDCISFGVDETYLISDPSYAGSDSLITTKILQAGLTYIDKLDPYQFVLFGNQTDDSGTGQVGPGVASRLDTLFFANIQNVTMQENHFTIENKDKVFLVSERFVASVKEEIKLPVPSIPNIFRARNKKVTILTNQELKLDKNEVGYDASPTNVISVQDCNQNEEAKCTILEGTVDELARKMMDMCRQYIGDVIA